MIPAIPGNAEKIVAIEEKLKSLPQVAIPITHDFAHGVYLRKMLVPMGTLITGKVHKFEHFVVILRGHASVLAPEGEFEVFSGSIYKSPAGTKRAIYAHTDLEWMNVHANPEELRDLNEIDQYYVVSTFAELNTDVIEGELG